MGENENTRKITRLLQRWHEGDQQAMDDLLMLVYEDLRRMAHKLLRDERRGHTLGGTDLVHEYFLKMPDQARIEWANRAHFFALVRRAMSRILIDYARWRGRQERDWKKEVPLDAPQQPDPNRAVGKKLEEKLPARQPDGLSPALLIDLKTALAGLEKLNKRKAQVMRLYYFNGLEDQEIAEIVGVHVNTVLRDKKFSRLWLRRAMEKKSSGRG